MKKFVLYQHAGSRNHGCEALATTISKEILRVFPQSLVTLCSYAPSQDNIDSVSELVKSKRIKKRSLLYLLYQIDKRFFNIKPFQNRFVSDESCIVASKDASCCIAIGGDNYCYSKGKMFSPTDRVLKKQGHKLMLWGASIEPKDLPGDLARHLDTFDLITVRESITYNALAENGLSHKTHLVSDPAFLLETECLPLPQNWKEGHMLGINLSPLILKYSQDKDTVVASIYKLIDYVLKDTALNIALIPHVRKLNNDDVSVMQPIFEKYKSTNRIVFFDDPTLNCKQLKGYISRCRFFIGARTHSIIAAYSTGVPAIALGYSVKAKGIARDLFGSEQELVLPVQTFLDSQLSINAINYLIDNENAIKDIYREKLPAYIENAKKSAELFKNLVNGD